MAVETWEGPLPEALAEEILSAYRDIFGQIDELKFRHRVAASPGLLTLTARENGVLAGFKIGYELEPGVFYSWLGGVREPFRRLGIARILMERQHARCRAQGYTLVRTKTYNRWKNMLILNLQCGFDITDVLEKADGEKQIVLEKKL